MNMKRMLAFLCQWLDRSFFKFDDLDDKNEAPEAIPHSQGRERQEEEAKNEFG